MPVLRQEAAGAAAPKGGAALRRGEGEERPPRRPHQLRGEVFGCLLLLFVGCVFRVFFSSLLFFSVFAGMRVGDFLSFADVLLSLCAVLCWLVCVGFMMLLLVCCVDFVVCCLQGFPVLRWFVGL